MLYSPISSYKSADYVHIFRVVLSYNKTPHKYRILLLVEKEKQNQSRFNKTSFPYNETLSVLFISFPYNRPLTKYRILFLVEKAKQNQTRNQLNNIEYQLTQLRM